MSVIARCPGARRELSVVGLRGVSIQMKATEQHFPAVLFIMLYWVVLTFEFIDEMFMRDHTNKCILHSASILNNAQSRISHAANRLIKFSLSGQQINEVLPGVMPCVVENDIKFL